jgi:hypothetical protein
MEAPGVLVRQVRKRRSAAEKRLIVEQALEPGASVARAARAHGLNANVVFNWRRFPVEIILLCVRWYCKYGISYRDLTEVKEKRHRVDDIEAILLRADQADRFRLRN